MVEVKEMLAPIGSKCRPGRARTGFAGVTIHNTGNTGKGADALSHGKYLQGGGAGTTASWHYAVDETLATRSILESEIAWHAGDGTGNGNYKTVAIEICMNSDGNITKATDNAAELAADILRRNGITKASGYLYQHNHWSGKNCPQKIRAGVPYSWDAFIKKVQSFLDLVTQEEEEMVKRYDKVSDLPASLQKEAQELVDSGALAGSNGKLDVTEDMIRTMIISKRYADKMAAGK